MNAGSKFDGSPRNRGTEKKCGESVEVKQKPPLPDFGGGEPIQMPSTLAFSLCAFASLREVSSSPYISLLPNPYHLTPAL